MLSAIPRFAPMFANQETPVPINPTSIETVTVQFLERSAEIPEHAPTEFSVEAVTMQYMQLGELPPELPPTVFSVETLFIQYLERA